MRKDRVKITRRIHRHLSFNFSSYLFWAQNFWKKGDDHIYKYRVPCTTNFHFCMQALLRFQGGLKIEFRGTTCWHDYMRFHTRFTSINDRDLDKNSKYSGANSCCNKALFMKQKCQIQMGVAQYKNVATQLSSKGINTTHQHF